MSKFIRRGRHPKLALKALEDNSTLQMVDTGLAEMAGELHADIKKKVHDFGLADAFVLATARRKVAKVLTGDPHFKGLPEALMI